MFWKKLDLEISLKPFADHSEAGIRAVGEKIFSQWRTMIENAESVSLMFWAADGSEILEYNGKMEDRFEWCKWIGVANPHGESSTLPREQQTMHAHPRYYMENPPEFTYGDFKRVIDVLRSLFREMYGKRLRIGATFDSGPEFAISDFKYTRHPEICRGFCLGGKTFVCCYTTLHADDRSYAGFPQGIPEGTTFGTFLGRQAQRYLTDMGFDYLWLSNGFGFGMETWGACGAIFDGQKFSPEEAHVTKEAMFGFWNDFRRECPKFPLETRGTNLSTGMDLASDATPTREIYREVYDIEAPVNSPWAALNGDFGMELAGWMSHIAELPAGKGYPFRYYTHDPWFVNSPWLDRYSRSPYDIYLPLSVTRLRADGSVEAANALHLLTLDDSYGRMPDLVPVEVSGYLYDAESTTADTAGPFIWVYPFEEYHNEVYAGRRLEQVFADDYLIRGAINAGFPVNTVVSSTNFVKAVEAGIEFQDRVLVMSTIFDISPTVLAAAEKHLAAGGKILFYGPARGDAVGKLLGLVPAAPIEGEMVLEGIEAFSRLNAVRHLPVYSGGPLDSVADPAAGAEILAEYVQGSERRPAALYRTVGNGGILWIRGTNSFEIRPGSYNPTPFAEDRYFHCERLFRYLLGRVGCEIEFHKVDPLLPDDCMTLRWHANGLYLVAYSKNTTGDRSFRFPDGAPVFCRCDTVLRNNHAFYHCERAVNQEGRIFVTGDDSVITCRDVPQCFPGIQRRIEVGGLKNATVVYRPDVFDGMTFNFSAGKELTKSSLCAESEYQAELVRDAIGPKFIIRNVTGNLVISRGVRHEFCASDR